MNKKGFQEKIITYKTSHLPQILPSLSSPNPKHTNTQVVGFSGFFACFISKTLCKRLKLPTVPYPILPVCNSIRFRHKKTRREIPFLQGITYQCVWVLDSYCADDSICCYYKRLCFYWVPAHCIYGMYIYDASMMT